MKKKIFLLILLLAGLELWFRPGYLLYREVSFHWEERSAAAWEIKAYAEANRIPIGRWPWELIELYEGNPETRDFVLNYPARQETETDLSRYAGERWPLFLQWDPMWGYEGYGSSVLGITGCGPTALAMAGYGLTGEDRFTPDRVADFSSTMGYYAPGYGSSWTLISEGGVELGLEVKELPLVKKKIVTALEKGHPVILALGPGDFTTEGHYILLTEATEAGFRVNDPNSIERSSRLWTYEQLEGQIRNIWEISK